jgi:hypothetical protein
MNFSTLYGPPVINGTYGLFMELLIQRSELVFSGLIGTAKTYAFFDPTVSYFRESYVRFVPHARPHPQWMSLVVIFETPVWFLVLLVYILSYCAVFILAVFKHATI